MITYLDERYASRFQGSNSVIIAGLVISDMFEPVVSHLKHLSRLAHHHATLPYIDSIRNLTTK